MISKEGLEVNTINDKWQIFAHYYEGLYKSSHPEVNEIDRWLDGIILFTICKMMKEHMQSLDRTITMQEIGWAITKWKIDRSLELDSQKAEFCKSFSDLVIPHVLELFKYCVQFGKILDT